MLKLVSSQSEFYGIHDDLAVRSGENFACSCAKCGRETSAPIGYMNALIWCVGCGLDYGHIPLIDRPCGYYRYYSGVTRDEAAAAERKAVSEGNYD